MRIHNIILIQINWTVAQHAFFLSNTSIYKGNLQLIIISYAYFNIDLPFFRSDFERADFIFEFLFPFSDFLFTLIKKVRNSENHISITENKQHMKSNHGIIFG
jgi:hypothetical protein